MKLLNKTLLSLTMIFTLSSLVWGQSSNQNEIDRINESGILGDARLESMSFSNNYGNLTPPELMLDQDVSTSYGLTETAGSAWVRLDFQDPVYLYGLTYEGLVPEGGMIFLQTEIDDRIVTLPSGYVNGSRSNGLIDVSLERMVSDNLILRIEGEDLSAFRLDEIELISEASDSILQKKELVPEDQSYNRFSLNNDNLLVDGQIGTVWNNTNRGMKNQVYWMFRRVLQEGYHDFEKWRVKDDLILNVITPGEMEFLKIFFTEEAQGTLTLSVHSDDNWVDAVEMHLERERGWQKVDLSLLGEIDQIRFSMEDPRQRWKPGVYGGIGEVELWAKDKPDQNRIIDLLNPDSLVNSKGLVFDIPDLREENHWLEIAESGSSETLPSIYLNSLELGEGIRFESNGMTYWEVPVPYYILTDTANTLRVDSTDDRDVISLQISTRKGNPNDFSDPHLNDGRLLSGRDYSETPLEESFNSGEMDIEEFRLYHGENGSENVYVEDGGIRTSLIAHDSNSYRDIYTVEGKADLLGMGFPGDLYEMEIAGSQNEILTPQIKLIYPEPGVELPQSSTHHQKVIGITDYPEGRITVNGVRAQVSGNYFWVEMRDLRINQPGEYDITAEVRHRNGNTGSDVAPILVEDESISLLLDQNDDLYYTREGSFTFSGNVRGGYIDLVANGETIEVSRRDGFTKTFALDEGLNYFTFQLMARDGETILKREVRQVFFQASTGGLKVTSPVSGGYTNQENITVSGSVIPWGLTSVFVNGTEATIDGQTFNCVCPLSEGENILTVSASYDTGDVFDVQITVYRDSTSPVIISVEPADGTISGDSSIIVSGYVQEDNAFTLFINGTVIETVGASFRTLTPLASEGNNSIQITARDRAGNEAVYPIFQIFRDTTGPVPFTVSSNVSGWTNNNRPIISYSTSDEGIGLSHYEVSINGHAFYPQESPYQVPYLPDSTDDEAVPVIVRAYDLLGNYTDSEIDFYIDTVAADVPSDFRAIPGKDDLELKWIETDDDVCSYILQIDNEEVNVSSEMGVEDEENSIVLFSYRIEDLEVGDVLSCQLLSVDRAGNLSESVDTTGLVGLSIVSLVEDEPLIVEYDDVNLFISPDTLPDEVTEVIVQELESEPFKESAVNPILSPVYSFTALTADEIKNHIVFDDLYVGTMEYNEKLIPEGFPEYNLAVYYFDTNWSKWVKVDRSAVDVDHNMIVFSSDHFTEFSVQATTMEDITPQELADVSFPQFSNKIAHTPVTVSPQGGSVSTSMTELVLPGKNGLDLDIRRIYDSATARGDAAGLNMYASVSLSDIITGSASDLIKQIGLNVLSGTVSAIEGSIEKYFQNNGDYSYSLGQGWRLNFPYLKTNNGGVMVRTPKGSFYNITSMDVDWDQSVSIGAARTLTLENHEGEDFTLKVSQIRADVSVSSLKDSVSNLKNALTEVIGSDTDFANGLTNYLNLAKSIENLIPSWITVGASLYTKEGNIYNFDILGRLSSITNATGDVIEFSYDDSLLLDYIIDTYGRKVRFEYQWVNGVSVSVPQVSRIWVEDDDREINYTYQEDRSDCMGQQLTSAFKLSLPLLDTATDVEGRTYDYDYDDKFLLASNIGAKINGIGLVLDILSYWTGGLTSRINSALGISGLTVYGGVQFEWIFPIERVEGSGIGVTKLDTDVTTLSYFAYDYCDYILGYIPTGMSFELASQERPCYSSLNRYVDGNLVFNESYSYNFTYGGYKQFYNSKTVVTNDYLRTEYSYSKKTLTRERCLDFSDVLAGGIFQDSHEIRDVVSLNTGITRYNLVGGSQYLDTKKMSYNNGLRLTYEKTAQAVDMYREVNYSYDGWGNQVKITTTEQAGEITSSQIISNQFQDNGISGYTNPFGSLTLNSPHIHDRLRGTVVSETVSGGILDEPRTLDNKVSWYDYNEYGQRTEERTLIDDADGEIWKTQKYEYYPVDGSFESGQLKASIAMDGEDELLRTDVEYTFDSGSYTQKRTSRDIIQHNDSSGTDRVQWTVYDLPTGNPILQHDALGYETEYEYDNLDRVTKTVKPDDNDLSGGSRDDNPVTLVHYDDINLTTTVTDPLGAKTVYSYNNLGQLVTIEKENRYPASETITTGLEYDGLGNISAVIDPRNNRTQYGYDGIKRLISETYYDGEDTGSNNYQKTYSYNNSLNRRTVTNEEGVITYEYLDMRGNVVKKVELDANKWTYRTNQAVYTLANQPLKTEAPLNLVNEYYYNAAGQLQDELEPEMTGFDGNDDFTGRYWHHLDYNNQNQLAEERVLAAEGSSGLPTSMPTDFLADKTFEYNGAGELISENYYYHDGDGVLNAQTVKHIYDEKGRELETIDGNGISTFKEYTARDQVSAEIDALESRTTYLYDDKDRVLSMTGPRGNSGNYPALDFTIAYDYDDLNRLIKGYLPRRADQSSKPEVTLNYDKRGNLLNRSEPDGGVTSYEYNFRNWPTTETKSGIDGEGNSLEYETSYSYDRVGNRETMTNAMGTWTSTYDAFNRLTQTTDPTGAATTLKYDKLDRQIKTTDGNGNSTSFVYDLYGNLTSQIDAAGYTTVYEFDLLGNRTKLTDPRNNSWVTSYDELSRVNKEINSRGGQALYSYDEGGRLLQLIDPNGTTIDYLYYDTGLPRRVAYTNGSQTQVESYTYDEAGAVKTATLDGVVKEYNLVDGSYQPDPMGLITGQSVSFDGKSYTTDYNYDVMNRLSDIGYAGGLTISQSWNNLGQLEGITNFAFGFTYNNVGYLESYEQNNGVSVSYDFTDNGLLASLDYRKANSMESLLGYAYSYDDAGNMTARNGDAYGYDVKNQMITASIVGDSLATEESVDYAKALHVSEDILGQEKAVLVGDTVVLDVTASSLVIDYTYPKRISKVIITPDEVDHRITPSTLAVFTSMYNNEGYYDEVVDPEITIDEATGVITVEFAGGQYARYMKLHCHFNELNEDGSSNTGSASFRISGSDAVEAYAIVGGRNEFYIYDGKGNRISKSIMSTDIESSQYEYYSDSDLLLNNGYGKYYYAYDANGNLTEKGTEATVKGDEVDITDPDELTGTADGDYAYFRYTYDLKNRLVQVDKSVEGVVIPVASYTYDVDGYRVSKTDRDESVIDYVFDLNGKILEEISADGSLQYVFIKERHLARIEGDSTLFYGTDHVNSTVLMTDENGEIVWSGDVSPFGDYSVIDSDAYEEIGLKYSGKDLDEDTGLMYFNARWYDADTGRFITEDPVRDGLNWYSYVSNNPMKFIDPTGLMTDEHREEYADLESNGASQEELQTARERFEQQEREHIDDLTSIYKSNSTTETGKDVLKKTILEYMGFYNRDIVPDSVEDYGGTKVTGDFDAIEGYENIESPHPGLDFVGGVGVATPFYTVFDKATTNQDSKPFVLSVPGTDIRMRIKHGDETDVMNLMKGVHKGGLNSFTPSQMIIPFPKNNNGSSSTNPHFHLEMTANRGSSDDPRRFINPLGLKTGKSLEYLYNKGTKDNPEWMKTNRYF